MSSFDPHFILIFLSHTRVEVCSLLLAHGADPTLLNCHSKSAVDAAPTRELQEKLACKYAIVFSPRLQLSCTWICPDHSKLNDLPIFINSAYFLFSPVEFKGHQLLEAAKSCDSTKLKKHITPEIINFQHPLTLESSLVSVLQGLNDLTKQGKYLRNLS